MSSDLHTAWSTLFVRALVAGGVRDFVISPGSRSTPLCLAAAREPALRRHTHVDERVAAFFALGIARETRAPVALLCTSGTAGAHWLPAVIEASQAYHPLVLITADRPWEAYDCAAPQTIDQSDLFGRYVRHRAELGLPDVPGLRAVARVAAQCVARALGPEPGPVHVNARFRKPLEPVAVAAPEPWAEIARSLCAPEVFHPTTALPDGALEALAAVIAGHPRGLVVGGPTQAGEVFHHARALARVAGYPLLAETSSGLRRGGEVPRCDLFDLVLRSGRFAGRDAPTLVLEFGLPPTSGAYAAWLAKLPQVQRWVCAPQGWPDPRGDAQARVFARDADIARLVARLAPRAPDDWCARWTAADAQAWSRVRAELADAALHEGHLAHELLARLRDGDALLVGNSMPVRDVDTFARDLAALRVHHQRGASGIDGTLAGAAGLRAVTPGDRAVAVILGDVTAVHDLGGLNAARHATAPLVMVTVQNAGGRIFAQLPLGARARGDEALQRAFAEHFLTPQALAFEGVCAACAIPYERVATRAGYQRALDAAFARTGPSFIEAVVPPEDATRRRAAIARDVVAALDAP